LKLTTYTLVRMQHTWVCIGNINTTTAANFNYKAALEVLIDCHYTY